MTLRIRRMLGGGKIKEGSFNAETKSPRKILEAMDRIAPGLSSTAILQPESNYTISFDATKHNLLLENELRKLRKNGIEFDFYTDINKKDKYEVEAVDITRPKYQERLFIEFSPFDDLEWSYIRGMFGLPSRVTEEVSDEETMETISDR